MNKNRRKATGALLLLLAMGAPACSLLDSDNVEQDLIEHEAQWIDQAILDYAFTFQWRCYCGGVFIQPVRITVTDGSIAGATFVESGEAVAAGQLENFRTIEGLFDFIHEALADGAYAVEADYHPQRGYPARAEVDFEKNTIDEEIGFEILEFTPLGLNGLRGRVPQSRP